MSASILDVLSQPFWQRITLALFHFLWQGIVVAILIHSVIARIPESSAAARCRVAFAGLCLLTACPLLTFWLLPDAQRAARSPRMQGSSRVLVPGPDSGWQRLPSIPGVGFAQGHGDLAPERASLAPPPALAEPSAGSSGWALLPSAARLQPYAIAAWLVGVSLLSLRLCCSSAATCWLRGRRRSLPNELQLQMRQLAVKIGVPTARAYISKRVRQAMVVGIVRPCILLPASWLTQLPPEALQAVLAHELAHLKRHDLWIVLFQRLVETTFFYHPAVWWLSRTIDVQREFACDDTAVAATGQRLVYAQSLERVASQTKAGVRPALTATIHGERKMKLLCRVRHVLDATPQSAKGRWWPAGLLLIVTALAVWGTTTDAWRMNSRAVADEEREAGERREGDRDAAGRDAPRERDGARDPARREGEERREVDRPRPERREGNPENRDRDVRREGDRERGEGDRREGDRREGDRREGDRREGDRREGDRREGQRPIGPREIDRPTLPRERALMEMIEQLRREVQMLRREVNEMRGRPPIRRDGDRPDVRRPDFRPDGDRPGPRRDGDRPDLRRDGDRRPDIRRDGDRPPVNRRDGEREGVRSSDRPVRRDVDRERDEE